ncbi:MAG: MATE family efflux transporter [Bacteroidales bacterium]
MTKSNLKPENATLLLLKLAWPVILSSLLHLTYNLIDMLWVGHIGSGAVAAVGSATFFINLGWAFASIITIGTTVSISHAVGAQNKKLVQKYVSSSLFAIVVLGLIYTVILLFTPEYLIGFFKITDQTVVDQATTYLRINAIGIIIGFFNLIFSGILDAHGRTKSSFRAVLSGNVVNMILDPILIIYMDLGVAGAACATVVSRTVAFIIFFSLIHRGRITRISFRHFGIEQLKKILSIGLPGSLQRTLFTLIAIFIGRIVADFGTDAIAAQKIGLQIESISFTIMGGLSQAMSILVGQNYGARSFLRIKHLYKAGLQINIMIGALMTVFFILFARELVAIFVRTPETILMGSAYLRIVGISQLFMGLDMMTAGTYNGQGMTKYPAVNSVIQTSLRIPLAYVLSHYTALGIEGVWWSISITSIGKGIVLYFMYRVRQSKLERLNQIELRKQMKRQRLEEEKRHNYPYSSDTINDN